MAYIYDEKTGEFVDTSAPKQPKKTTTTQTADTGASRNTITSYPRSTTPSSSSGNRSSSENNGGCILGGLLFLAIQVLPYLILGGLASMCS